MQILSLNFVVYSLSGIWRPIEWSSSCAKSLYNVFTFFTIGQLYFMMLTQLMDLILIVDNMDDFINNSLILVSVITVCSKATIAVLRRNAIIGLIEMLMNDPCKPRDEDELAIRARIDAFIRSWTKKYVFLATSSMISVTLRSMQNVLQGYLPYRVWLPYDSTKTMSFWITSIHQMIVVILGTYINVGTETLVFGLILQTCAQLDILESRLNKLVFNKTASYYQENHSLSSPSSKQASISEHIRHHLRIITYAKTVNSVFNEVLFVQFFGSILVLCTSVYYLSTHVTDVEAAGIVIYTICMFVQIYFYCWSGNEVMLKSARLTDAVYHMDWFSLSISERKDLLMIMRRSTVPIKFVSSFLITLSLQSYGNILKTSYSAFNVLQQS